MARRRRRKSYSVSHVRRGGPQFFSPNRPERLPPPQSVRVRRNVVDDYTPSYLRLSAFQPVVHRQVFTLAQLRPRVFSPVSPPPVPRYGRRLNFGKYSALRQLAVKLPSRVKFCLDRRERREVLFAKRLAGYSGSARKRYWNRSQNSQYSC